MVSSILKIINIAAWPFALVLLGPAHAADTKVTGNSIETISIEIEGKTGDPQPQYFTKKVKAKIVKIFDQKSVPPIGGVVNVSGIGADIAIVEIRASGYPGKFSSTVTFQVMY